MIILLVLSVVEQFFLEKCYIYKKVKSKKLNSIFTNKRFCYQVIKIFSNIEIIIFLKTLWLFLYMKLK